MPTFNDIPLIIRPHARARRLKLRYDAAKGAAVVTLPPGMKERHARNFVEQNREWLTNQMQKSPPSRQLVPGEQIPLRGENHLLVHVPDNPARITVENRHLLIGGRREGFEVRLQNWLKKQARLAVEERAGEMILKSGKKFRRISVRDTKSRWGSCSSTGTLSFCWRLILAPPEVLDYVVAHEVAHLHEMNHSAAFWRVVDELVPHAKKSRKWLRDHGPALMVIST